MTMTRDRRSAAPNVEPVYVDIGRRIKTGRERRGYSQYLLAQMLTPPLTRSALCNMELGRQRIMLHVLIDLADALGVRVGQLLPDRRGREMVAGRPLRGRP